MIYKAGRLGLEPRFYPPEGHVLPLDDLPALKTIKKNKIDEQINMTRNKTIILEKTLNIKKKPL